MRHFAIIALLAPLLVLAPAAVRAQAPGDLPASEDETRVLGEIAKCLLAGLPQDWRQAEMKVDLTAPGADGGEVSYLVTRMLAGGAAEPFLPCDGRQPARVLAEMRKIQTPQRAAWSAARFVIHRDGKFELKYDYPKKN
jgi:hypothetical protein